MDYERKDPVRLGRIVVILLYVWLAVNAIYTLSSIVEWFALSGLEASMPVTWDTVPPGTEVADQFNMIAGMAFFLTYIVTGLVILMWIHRVNRNAHVLNSCMAMSPGWNVAWFFVPAFNLIRPYQGVRQTWQVSYRPDDPEAEPVPVLLRWWWGLWLAASIIGNFSFRMSMQAETVGDLSASFALDAATALIDLPLALVFMKIVKRLSTRQSLAFDEGVFE